MHRSALVPSLLTAAVVLAACGGDAGSGTTPRADDRPTATVGTSAPATDEPAEPAGPPDAGTVDAAPDDQTPADGGSSGGDTGGGFPPEVVPTQGARVWAVYLAVGTPFDESQAHLLGETESYANGLGYTGSGIGSVGCDQGAAEQLGLAPDDNRVAVYFATAEHAQQFVAVYDRPDLGSAEVATYCLD
ncbi:MULTISPECIES: hypothetical protein [unclassified Geodermatophilus]|uniref:hypothetical protein n=1 Tax=unclassified Geodermatophilus TaxID=2637632 RepID=UPI003EEB3FB4